MLSTFSSMPSINIKLFDKAISSLSISYLYFPDFISFTDSFVYPILTGERYFPI